MSGYPAKIWAKMGRAILRAKAGKAAALILGALAVLSAPSATWASEADDSFLQRMEGEWRGTGRVRERIDTERERVSCRMTAQWQSATGQLSMDFDCRGTDFEFSSSGFLASLDRDGHISGQWRAGGRGQASVSGSRSGSTLSLQLTSQDSRTGEERLSSMSISLSGNGNKLTNVITAVDQVSGETYTVLNLTLRR